MIIIKILQTVFFKHQNDVFPRVYRYLDYECRFKATFINNIQNSECHFRFNENSLSI
jgi:hypothetical protein